MEAGLDKIRGIAERVAQSSGLELVDVELHGGGKARMLRIYIDKPGGVTHENCANFSREAGTIFDVEDAVPGGSYLLEVSSPGLDRKLSKPEDYQRFLGSLVKLMTRDPVNGNRHFEGRLKAFAGRPADSGAERRGRSRRSTKRSSRGRKSRLRWRTSRKQIWFRRSSATSGGKQVPPLGPNRPERSA